jgi:hypothetical protein
VIKAIVLVAATLGEHWVCAMPNKLEPAHAIIFDFQFAGTEIIETSPSLGWEIRYRIMQNDNELTYAVRPYEPTSVDTIRIYKQNRSFTYTHIGENSIQSEGDCMKMEDDKSP